MIIKSTTSPKHGFVEPAEHILLLKRRLSSLSGVEGRETETIKYKILKHVVKRGGCTSLQQDQVKHSAQQNCTVSILLKAHPPTFTAF